MKLHNRGRLYFTGILLIFVFFLCERINGAPSEPSGSIHATQLQSDPESVMAYYVAIADNYIQSYNFDQSKIYLDSASHYEKEVLNPSALGNMYSSYGIYYSFKRNDMEAHNYYYKAIKYYEKAENTDMLVLIYHNLAFSYIQKEDIKSLKKIIDKMRSVVLKTNEDIVNTYRIMAFYYSCLFEKGWKQQTVFLDSAIYYDSQIISIVENTKTLNVLPKDIAYSYINLASNLLEKKTADHDTLVHYLKKAEELANPVDTAMIINTYWVKGEIAFNKGQLMEAEQLFNEQLSVMDQWSNGKELSMYLDVYSRLSEISEIKGEYKEALLYEHKKITCLNEIHDAQKYETIRELETKYEVKQTELENIQLKKSNILQKQINLLSACIFILGVVSFIFIIYWLKSKKKAADSQLKLTKAEKNEAILQVQLKEEQLKKIELEKYEALLDSHFKDLQISGKDDELEELRREQNQLNTQVKNYAEKVQKYENRKQLKPEFETNDPYFTSIIRTVFDLILKKLPNIKEQKEYIEKISIINDSFFLNLQKNSKENLSALHMQHCVCYLIGMEIPHIAECFSIQVRTVHTIRHRVKTNLKVDKAIDLDLSLRQMS